MEDEHGQPGGGDEEWFTVLYRRILSALGCVSFVALYCNARVPDWDDFHFGTLVPSFPEIPIILSPLVILLTTYAVCGRYIATTCKITNGVSLILGVLVTLLAGFLSSFHQWQGHILVMILMFVAFVLWDWVVLKFASERHLSKEMFDEVKLGSRAINVPTLLAFIALYLYLFGVSTEAPNVDSLIGQKTHTSLVNHMQELQTPRCECQGKPAAQPLAMVAGNSIKPLEGDLKSATIDAFANGIVAFHMTLSALMYWAISNKKSILDRLVSRT